jgi:cilia- and flagella-associated protein 298
MYGHLSCEPCFPALLTAYPMGLPEYDIIRSMIEGTEEVAGTAAGAEYLEPDTTELWWAGKEFLRDGVVKDRVGTNEKTKVVARLQKRGSGPPVREAAVSEEERRAMMAFYYKKQEEAKRLAENDEDAYLASQWADPKALKSSLLGTSGISWGPGGRK